MANMKRTKGEIFFKYFNYIFLFILTLIFLLPFIQVLATSMVTEEELIRRGARYVLYPQKISLESYKILFSTGSRVYNAYAVTLFRIIVGTGLNLLFTTTLAYGLSRKSLRGRNFFMLMILLTMLFSGGLIPNYMLVSTLNLRNTLWALVFPGLISAWNMIIMKSFFSSQIPASLEESATIDGATAPVILWNIVIPLSLPVITTIGLFYAVSHWNAWFDAAIYISDINKYPMQVILRNILYSQTAQSLNPELLGHEEMLNLPPTVTIRSTLIIITTLPILAIYPFVQKYFVKGVMIGSIKG